MRPTRHWWPGVLSKENNSLNNNRNNRRRGRNNNRGQGGGNQLNRIDSRARGNAPQLLEKYKKLAQDAQHNGDRVQMEYYLQFADHYFRVLADNKARQDEARGRRDDRDDGRDSGRDSSRDDRRDRANDDDGDDYGQDERNQSRRSRQRYDLDDGEAGSESDSADGDDSTRYEPAENPFVRDNPARGEGRRQRRPRTARSADAEAASDGIDAAALPPSIGAEDGEAPRKRAPRRRKPAADSADDAGQGDKGDETLSAVG
ncbi:MAG: DUF4167 domain-containing protein [Sphingomonadales bacterium]|nr:DUF4167 domain-containing protein [Sphingomonadales bacterium]MBD3772985.1 DUF4167 domain-containing protein [Paracoccaceae bacterium]